MNDRLTDEQIEKMSQRAASLQQLEARGDGDIWAAKVLREHLASTASAVVPELLATRAELAALRERLPRTADGVTILPGMEAFTTMCGLRVTGWVDGLLVDSLGAVTVWIRWVDARGLERSTQVAGRFIYSTAAARDAAEGGA